MIHACTRNVCQRMPVTHRCEPCTLEHFAREAVRNILLFGCRCRRKTHKGHLCTNRNKRCHKRNCKEHFNEEHTTHGIHTSSIHEHTKNGHCPFFVCYSRNAGSACIV